MLGVTRRTSASAERVQLTPAGLEVQNLWAPTGTSVRVATNRAALRRPSILSG